MLVEREEVDVPQRSSTLRRLRCKRVEKTFQCASQMKRKRQKVEATRIWKGPEGKRMTSKGEWNLKWIPQISTEGGWRLIYQNVLWEWSGCYYLENNSNDITNPKDHEDENNSQTYCFSCRNKQCRLQGSALPFWPENESIVCHYLWNLSKIVSFCKIL